MVYGRSADNDVTWLLVMKKFWVQIIFLTLIILGSLSVFYNPKLLSSYLPIGQQSAIKQIKIDETVLDIEVADNSGSRSRGLSGRESLATGSGMLFVFPKESKYQFWMKGMKISLDLIFIRKGKVVDLMRNVLPPPPGQKDAALTVYEPIVPIDMMLEVNSGFIDAHSIRIGSQIFLVGANN